jgi:hypothetical protein
MIHKLTLALAIVPVLASVACTEVDSEDVKTDGMFANYVARVKDNGTSVEANLNVGGGNANATNVELTGDDVIKATIGEKTLTLGKNPEFIDINDPHYSAFFDEETDAGTEVVFAFERTSDESAPSSKVKLASAPAASGPAAATSRAEASVVVSFDAGADDEKTSVTISGDCFQSATDSVDGSGATSITFEASALKEPQPPEGEEPEAPKSCEATITVQRSRTGSIDPAFGEGGLIQSIREETLTYTSDP